MKRPNLNLYPPGGWQYRHSDGEEFFGQNREELTIKLVEYLLRRGDPTEGADDLIDAFICASRPSICAEERQVNLRRVTSPTAELAAKIGHFLALCVKTQKQKVNGIPRVSPDIARARAKICQQCPANREWAVTCKVCEESVKHASDFVAKAGPRIAEDKLAGLKGCSKFGYHLPTAIRIAFEKFEDSAPAHCWRRNPTKQL